MTIRQLTTRSLGNAIIIADKIANGTITLEKLDAQTQANINLGGANKANVSDLTTANVSELTNLYFTNARSYSNVVQLGYATTGFFNSNVAIFPTGDYGSNVQILTVDGFGVFSDNYYDCMDPKGRSVTVDLN